MKTATVIPSISVCIITFNHEKYIGHAIESVLAQKCDYPVTIVIGEDFSTDNTRKICEKYATEHSSIILLPSEKNHGISKNFARTLQACTGDYVAICEGDDYWTDEKKLQTQVDFLEQEPTFSLCFHRVDVDDNGKIKTNAYVTVPASETTATDLAKSNFIFTPSVVYRNAFLSMSEISARYNTIYDYVIWMECAMKGNLKFMDKAMANYRLHADNKWATFNRSSRLFTWLEIIYTLEKRFPDLKVNLDVNKSSTLSVFLDDLYADDGLIKLNELLKAYGDEALLLNALKNRILQLRSSTSYRLGRRLVSFADALLRWRKKK